MEVPSTTATPALMASRPEPSAPPNAGQRLAAGTAHTCAIKEDGTLWCWGSVFTSSGERDPVLDPFGHPKAVKGLSGDTVAVSAGRSHTCAVARDGSLRCWGGNYFGQLGLGTRDGRLHAPERVVLGHRVAEIAAGWDQTCARLGDGGVWCWGNAPDSNVPSAPPPLKLAAFDAASGALAAGQGFVCALQSSHALACTDNGLLFPGNHGRGPSALTEIEGLGTAAVRVAAGRHYACAVRHDGTVGCWGSNEWVVGGGARRGSAELVPITALGSDVVDVAAGEEHACARKRDGSLWCWGENGHGQLGDGTTTSRAAPVHVGALSDRVAEVAAGSDHTCARTEDGAIWCWGWAIHGALGTHVPGVMDQPTPVRVAGQWP